MNTLDNISNYIAKIMDDNNFIDIGVLLEMLKHSNLTISEKCQILNKVHLYNLSIIRFIENENEKLSQNNGFQSNDKHTSISYLEEINEDKIISKPLNINVTGIIHLISDMKSTEEIDEFIKQNISIDQYTDTINCLIAHFLEEKITIKKLKNEEFLSKSTPSDILDEELSRITFLLECLFKLQHENIDVEANNKNIILYLTTDRDNISIANDLKVIPIEYYDSFYNLLLSIQTGNFKNFKRIGNSTCNYKSSLLEVKEHQTRIVFNQIEANIYMILTMFVKKVNNSKDYQINLKNVDSLFSNSLPFIMKELQNNRDEYVETNNRITEILSKKLLTKNQGGDLNGCFTRKNK